MKILRTFLILSFFTTSLPIASDQNRLKYYEKALENYKDKDHKKAIKNFQKFIKEQPYQYEVRNALFYLGDSLLKEKQYLKALSNFRILSKRYPNSKYRKDVIFKIGECYYLLKITRRSERRLQEYLKKSKIHNINNFNHIDANMYLGLMAKNRRNYKKAIQNLQFSLQLLGKREKKFGMDEGMEERFENIYYELGLIYAKHFKKNKIAYYYLKKYVKSKEDIPKSLKFLWRGLTLFHLDRADGLPDKAISDIKVDGDDVWVSTWGHGVVRFSRSAEKFVPIRLPSSQVRSLYVDFDKVYFATYDGIFIYNKSSRKVTQIQAGENLFTLAQKVIKDDRYIYFSTLSTGVVRYDTIRNSTVVLDDKSFLGSRYIYALAADHRYLIFGTLNKGVIIYEKKGKKAVYLDKKHLGGNNIKAILIDGRFVWIGVHKYGIYKYDLVQKKVYKMNWKIPYPTTFMKREHEIWIGNSGNGIFLYDQKKDALEQIRAIEGLASNEIHLIETEGDYIWIGYLDSGIDVLYRPFED